MVKAAQAKLESGEGNKEFYEAKIKTARFFMQRLLPEADGRFKMVLAGAETLMDMDAEAF